MNRTYVPNFDVYFDITGYIEICVKGNERQLYPHL